jgi:hypothetical protein
MELLAALDQGPDVSVAGPGLPDPPLEPHLDAARTWCLCDACAQVRANLSLPDLLERQVKPLWLLYHTAWWEGITPEIRASAAANKVAIPPALANHTPMGVPAPFL